MALDFNIFAILLLLTPFALAMLAPLISQETGRAAGWILAILPAGLFACLLSLAPGVAHGEATSFSVSWVPVLGLDLGFRIDGLSLVFGLLITGIGAFILVYSGAYLDGARHRGRFLAFMLLFMGAMLGLVLADTLVALFAFWELTSVTSFLLIGYHHEQPASRRAAIQALVVTGMGGLGLLAGGVLLHETTGSWQISALATLGGSISDTAVYPWIVGFILVAAFTKSAQFPFHFWLPNAMEAPTPVSAYLHSATMVQAGIYLLSRLTPVLGDTPLWQVLLCGFGSVTLLWGAVLSLKQVDLKQILAYSTIASLGALVLLIGLGGETAAMAVAAYFVAHALYKAGLFLSVGIIDHETGTRDITQLGGLRDSLTITFIAAALAALSMFGLPPFLGYLAKEEMYAGLGFADLWGTATIAVLVIGNALLGGVALAIAIRPFLGALKPTPKPPHEGPIALWMGPALFGLLGLGVVFAVSSYGETFLAPMASAIYGHAVESHLAIGFDVTGLPFWLSVATWAIGILTYLRLDQARRALLAVEARLRWNWDKGFDQFMFGLIRLGGAVNRGFQHGRLELYLTVVFVLLALAILLPLIALDGVPALPQFAPLTIYEWAAIAMAGVGLVVVLGARTRLGAIVALGIQGSAISLIFLFFGAPDLGFTQLMVEILSVVVLALVMTRLHLAARDLRPFTERLRDGITAALAGLAAALLLFRVLQTAFDQRLSVFFADNSVPIAHGHNIVNVILVDFRGLDTLGEISVVMTAGIAILALLRRQHKRPDAPMPSTPRGQPEEEPL